MYVPRSTCHIRLAQPQDYSSYIGRQFFHAWILQFSGRSNIPILIKVIATISKFLEKQAKQAVSGTVRKANSLNQAVWPKT